MHVICLKFGYLDYFLYLCNRYEEKINFIGDDAHGMDDAVGVRKSPA